jgi:8-oxo-dGTP diphosphatase
LQLTISRFNIRAYFILFNDCDEILLSDELIAGKNYTKFPGGGVELGEGIEDAIRREAIEELGQEVEIVQHIYTTGFFVQSAFRPNDQIISVYYQVHLVEKPSFRTTTIKFDFDTNNPQTESFRWAKLSDIQPNELSFPADKYLLQQLQSHQG